VYRTLVVDDEPQVRDLTQRALAQCQLQCDLAGDGDEAMRMFNQAPYDAVITDLKMPKRHGHSLATELLSRPKPPKLFVVTGLADARIVRDLVARGAEDVLHKPVNFDVLAMKVLALSEKNRREAEAAKPVASRTSTAEVQTQKLAVIERSLVELTTIFEDALRDLMREDVELSCPPKAVSDFIIRFAQLEEAAIEAQGTHEKRQQERALCHATAVAVPVTRRYIPCGEPFKLAIRDVSEGGIRLLHTRATNAEFLALSWPCETMPSRNISVLIQVTRCQPLSPFYDIGGKFVLSD